MEGQNLWSDINSRGTEMCEGKNFWRGRTSQGIELLEGLNFLGTSELQDVQNVWMDRTSGDVQNFYHTLGY